MRILYYIFSLLTLLTVSFSTSFCQSAYTDVAFSAGIDHRAYISDTIFATQGGIAWFDYDNDHDDDLYLTGGANSDAFFKNNGDGTFSEVTAAAGFGMMNAAVFTMGASSGDLDNDGFREVFITTEDGHPNYLFYNKGDGTFEDISSAAGVDDVGNSSLASFGDFNLDGFLDIYVANWCVEMYEPHDLNDTFPTIQNFFYINNGDLTFTESAGLYGIEDNKGCSFGGVFTDFDNDTDPDLLIANDFGQLSGNNENSLFENQYPSPGFTDISQVSGADFGMNGMGLAVGDYDEDGDLDYYVSNVRNDVLMKNMGGTFVNELIAAGLENDTVPLSDYSEYREGFGWGCGFFDFNNDTYLDLFVANGDIGTWWQDGRPTLDSNKLFLNNADGTFTDISVQAGVSDPYMSRAFAHADYDNDGDLDLLVGISDSIGGTHHSFLYQNNLASGNWLKVSLEGVMSNRDGYGARLEAMFQGRKLIREADGGSSFNSHHSSIVHFGLASVSTLDTLRVIWPGGVTDEFYQVHTNQHIKVIEQNGYGLVGLDDERFQSELSFIIYPNPGTRDGLRCRIHTGSKKPLSLALYDVFGRMVSPIFSNKLLQSDTDILLDIPKNLQAGMYYLKLTDGRTHRTKPISILK